MAKLDVIFDHNSGCEVEVVCRIKKLADYGQRPKATFLTGFVGKKVRYLFHPANLFYISPGEVESMRQELQ